jgi:hypothetical protein
MQFHYLAVLIMRTQNIEEGFLAKSVAIALGGIAILVASSSLLLVQSTAATTTDAVTETEIGGQETAGSTIVAANDNVSNAVLGTMFLTGEDKLTSFNPINKTYTEISYVGNRTIMPTEGVSVETIRATETGNLTFNLKQNGISVIEGQSLLVTEGGLNNGSEQENATVILVDLNGVRPEDPRSSTGVAFFKTNSTGQLSFLDNMIAIYQVKASPAGTVIAYWEWKGADLPFRPDSTLEQDEPLPN